MDSSMLLSYILLKNESTSRRITTRKPNIIGPFKISWYAPKKLLCYPIYSHFTLPIKFLGLISKPGTQEALMRITSGGEVHWYEFRN